MSALSTIPPRGFHRHSPGFSLVEITLALGIVATVLVALMGLLPMGMDSIRTAKSNMVEARIAYEIMGELQVADWGKVDGNLRNYDGQIRRYDGEGTVLKDSKDSKASDAIYQAKIEISEGPTRLPGAGGASSQYLRHAVVKVAYAPNGRTVKFSEDDPKKRVYKVFTSELAKLNHD